ncbi:inositol monophosphatase family protein [Mesobaculum littorinae]|uniref:Inositol monophosphatase family protein n=1 Tax=Mesobaculum littorinae TaxID=2486419 RepID=A0A438AE04_9RHOB|nr:inositol monophosphatase family protein [Mesobaculum littorinae]RVV96924.1 inositol monophosphatase family protein [Mesobaculum littorinae]
MPGLPDAATQHELRETALALADAARVATLRHFRRADLDADNKAGEGFDPVTAADREAETAMREILAARRPDDAIFGEEFGATEGRSGWTWVLDPVDGTRGFLSGTPTWGVLIAVGRDGGPELGVIDQPYIGERFFGGFGAAWCDGPQGRADLRTRPARPLDQAIVFTTFPEVGTTDERAGFTRVAEAARLVRYGMDCYAYALLAAGQIDLVIEAGLQSYDIQGPLAVIEAAGGVVTDWQGGPAHQGGRVVAAANAQIHADALARLSGRS